MSSRVRRVRRGEGARTAVCAALLLLTGVVAACQRTAPRDYVPQAPGEWFVVNESALATVDEARIGRIGFPGTPPRLVQRGRLEVPDGHPPAREGGLVIVTAVVAPTGEIARARVVRGVETPGLRANLLRCLRDYEWEPAMYKGEAWAVEFQLSLIETSPSEGERSGSVQSSGRTGAKLDTTADARPQLAAASAGDDPYPVAAFSLPPRVERILDASGISQTHRVSFHVNPFYLHGDFDGDQLLDTAVLMRERKTGKSGIAILHGGSNGIVLLGAGRPLGFAQWGEEDDVDWLDAWQVHLQGPVGEGVEAGPPPALVGDALLVMKSESSSGLIYWTGETYAWYQQGD